MLILFALCGYILSFSAATALAHRPMDRTHYNAALVILCLAAFANFHHMPMMIDEAAAEAQFRFGASTIILVAMFFGLAAGFVTAARALDMGLSRHHALFALVPPVGAAFMFFPKGTLSSDETAAQTLIDSEKVLAKIRAS